MIMTEMALSQVALENSASFSFAFYVQLLRTWSILTYDDMRQCLHWLDPSLPDLSVSPMCAVRRKLWTNPTFLQPAEIIFWEWNTLLEPCNHSTAACDKKVTRTLKKYSPFLDKWAMMFCKRASVQMLHFYLILSYLFIFITLYVSAVSSPQKSNNCGQGWFNIWHNTMVHVVCSWVKLIYNSEQIQQTLLMFLISVDQEQYVYKWWSHSHPIHSACRKQIWEPV